jgi:hypothetical protein
MHTCYACCVLAVTHSLWCCGQGQVVCGNLNSKTLGKSANGLIHILMNDVGPDGARSFIDQVCRCTRCVLASA